MNEEQIMFRASLQDDASAGLRTIQTETKQLASGMESSGRRAAQSLDPVQQQIRKTESATSRFASAVKGNMGKIAAAFSGLYVIRKVATFFKEAFSAGAKLETTRKTLTGLYQDAGLAAKTLQQLADVAKTSPLDFGSYQDAANSLAYAGVQGERAVTILKNVGLAITAVGGSSENLDRASAAILKMVNLGKVSMITLNQLSSAGAPVLSGLAELYGTSIETVNKMGSAGQVKLEDVLSVMENATGATFQSMLKAGAEASKSFANQWKIAKDAVVQSIGKMLIPLLESLAPIVAATGGFLTGTLIPAFSALASMLGAIPAPIKAIVAGFVALALVNKIGLIGRLSDAMSGMGGGLSSMAGGFTGAATAFGSFGFTMKSLQAQGFSKMGSMFKTMGGRAKRFGGALLGAVGGPAGLAITGAIALVTWGLSKLGQAQDDARKKAEAHEKAIENLSAALTESSGKLNENVRKTAADNLTDYNDSDLTKLGDLSGGRITQTDLINAQLGDSAAQKSITAGLKAAKAARMAAATDKLDTTGYGPMQKASIIQGARNKVTRSDDWKELTTLGDAATSIFGAQLPAMIKSLNAQAGVQDVNKQFTMDDIQKLLDSGKALDAADAYRQLAKSVGIVTKAEKDAADQAETTTDGIVSQAGVAGHALTQMQNTATADWMKGLDNPVAEMYAKIGDAADSASARTDAFRQALNLALGIKPDTEEIEAAYNAAVAGLTGKGGLFGKGTADTGGKIEGLVGAGGKVKTGGKGKMGAAGRDFRAGSQTFFSALDTSFTQANVDAGGGEAGRKAAKKVLDQGFKDWSAGAASVHMDPTEAKSMIERVFGPGGSIALATLDQVDTSQFELAVGTAAKAAGDDVDAQIQAGVNAAADWVQGTGMNIPTDLDTGPAGISYAAFKSRVEQTLSMRVDANVYETVHRNAVSHPGTAEYYSEHGAAPAPAPKKTWEAMGHVVKAASGLIRQPMIAPGGSNIMWAEPETGWEAYIPGADKYRGRAQRLLAEVANRFGGTYLPPQTALQPAAAGQISAIGPTGSRTQTLHVDVQVDARGQSNPGEIGQQVGDQVRQQLLELLRADQERSL